MWSKKNPMQKVQVLRKIRPITMKVVLTYSGSFSVAKNSNNRNISISFWNFQIISSPCESWAKVQPESTLNSNHDGALKSLFLTLHVLSHIWPWPSKICCEQGDLLGGFDAPRCARAQPAGWRGSRDAHAAAVSDAVSEPANSII